MIVTEMFLMLVEFVEEMVLMPMKMAFVTTLMIVLVHSMTVEYVMEIIRHVQTVQVL